MFLTYFSFIVRHKDQILQRGLEFRLLIEIAESGFSTVLMCFPTMN